MRDRWTCSSSTGTCTSTRTAVPGIAAPADEEFGVPVIGVAKTAFRSATHAIPVLRGKSVRPLQVTAIGLAPDEAARIVRTMAGPHRLPDALRRVDRLSRE
ncbi:endonuclease V [Amycolatopsis thermoflava]|uniref:hypothetical protein n=1 Tax=Amycolatopsis thermoflava TaxID=84480 RepID=UPI001ABF6B83|nr:hypothetical protein [Amycolatopsis thermoflava]